MGNRLCRHWRHQSVGLRVASPEAFRQPFRQALPVVRRSGERLTEPGERVVKWWEGDSRAGSPGFGSVLSALFGDGVQSPLARDAFELVRSAVLEADPRSG